MFNIDPNRYRLGDLVPDGRGERANSDGHRCGTYKTPGSAAGPQRSESPGNFALFEKL